MKTSTREAILRELKAAQDVADSAEKETRDLTGDERQKIKAHIDTARDLKAKDEDASALRKQLGDLTDGLGLAPKNVETEAAKAAGFTAVKGSVGKAFTESPEFKALMGMYPNGQVSEKMRVQSQPFGVKALVTGLSDTSAGALVVTDERGLLTPVYGRPLTLRDLVTKGTTGTDTIEYVRTTTMTNNAAPVAEATTAALPTQNGTTGALINNAGGGYKPESSIALEKVTTTVKTLAHWMPATKRALSDAGQVRTLIDQFLLYGLEEELEDQMLNGNGSGENFDGISHVSGTQTETAPAVDEDMLTVTRRARTKVRIGGRANPSAYMMNPLDWEKVELLRNENGAFYGSGPFNVTQPRLWGLPVVESEAVTEGTAWVADWSFAVLYDREQASIQVTDSHADFFIRNLVAILAEMRAAFAVLRPAAFVEIPLTA